MSVLKRGDIFHCDFWFEGRRVDPHVYSSLLSTEATVIAVTLSFELWLTNARGRVIVLSMETRSYVDLATLRSAMRKGFTTRRIPNCCPSDRSSE